MINTYQTPCGTEKQGIKKETRKKKTNLTRKGENEHVSQKSKVAPLSVRRSIYHPTSEKLQLSAFACNSVAKPTV